MKLHDFEFEDISSLRYIAEELSYVEDDELVRSLGNDIQKAYDILKAKQKLIEGDYNIHSYNERILELI